MRFVKKVLALLLLLVIFNGFNFANAVGPEVSAQMMLSLVEKNVKVGDTINIVLSLENVKGIEGIDTIGGKLTYNHDDLEYKQITGQNGWPNPMYNVETGMFTIHNNELKKNGNILKVTFLVKNKPVTARTKVTVAEFDVSDGNTDQIATSNVSIEIPINDKIVEPSDPTTKPSDPTTKPSDPTTKPSDPTTKPSDPTAKPSDPTAKPSDPTAKPSDPTAKPSEPTAKPSDPTAKPDVPTVKPDINSNNKVNDDNTTKKEEKLPQLGVQNVMILVLCGVSSVTAIITYVLYRKNSFKK